MGEGNPCRPAVSCPHLLAIAEMQDDCYDETFADRVYNYLKVYGVETAQDRILRERDERNRQVQIEGCVKAYLDAYKVGCAFGEHRWRRTGYQCDTCPRGQAWCIRCGARDCVSQVTVLE